MVGDSDPLEVLSSTIGQFKKLLAGVDEKQATAIPHGSWSINDVLQHLVDAETVNGYRFRMALSSYRPQLPGFNQDYWVERFNTNRAIESIVKDWELIRSYNLRLIESITDEEMDREYLHEERGVETVADLLHLMAGHDLLHLQQVIKLIDAT